MITPFKIAGLICLIFLLGIVNIFGQGCIEYAEIEGTECSSCTPEDWDATSSSPDLVNPTSTLCFIGESPSGGNAIHLFSNGSSDIEGIITEITIDPFVPGAIYYFSIYTAQCGNASSSIEMTIDGEDYSIDPTDEWEVTELCLTPSSSTFDLFLTVSPYSGGSISNTLIDSGVCDPTFCCSLISEIEEGPIELCPDEEYTIDSDYAEGSGSITVEWTCEPSSGIDFLDNPTDINPTFYIPPQTDFESETFVFTFSVTDDDCTVTKEIEIEVEASLVPEIDILLCEVFEDQELPLISLDPFSGTWQGDFDFEYLGGTTQEYIFTLDPGQENCITEWTYEFDIELEEIVEFEFLREYCITDDERYDLPKESENRIEGEWDIDRFRPSDYEEGVYIFTFYPYIDEHCSLPFEMEIEIFEAIEPTFDFPTSFCIQKDSLVLPTVTLEGVQGTWNQTFIDLNIAGEYNLTFTPEDIFDCYTNLSTTVTVANGVSNTFNLPDTLCKSYGLFTFDSLSIEGNLGIWTPQEIDIDTILTTSFSSIWMPIDTGCQNQVSAEIFLTEPIVPIFEIPSELCRSFGTYILPLVSINGIEGSWSSNEIQTNTILEPTVSLTFTPQINQCAVPVTTEINIIQNIIPEFNIQQVFCEGESEFILSTVSDNNISGTWSIPVIDPSSIVNEVSSTFIPDASSSDCIESTELTFTISESILPEFTLPEYFCAEDEIFNYPLISNNGIEGSWNIEQYNSNIGGNAIKANTFTPNNLDCYLPYESQIEVLLFDNLQIESISPSTCSSEDGSIAIINSNSDMSFSIDGGVIWQTQSIFNNLQAGNYEIEISFQSILPSCSVLLNSQLTSPESAQITNLEIGQISNCSSADGSVTCVATGNNLEYSVDNGNSWQVSNLFENLVAGTYTITVRSDGSLLCSDSEDFTIEAFLTTQIIDVVSTDPTDCNNTDGTISIEASGEQLEYSIDNGSSWQLSNLFIELASGDYNIVVQSQIANDCQAQSVVTIFEIPQPSIDNVVIKNVSNCDVSDGEIEIITTSNNIEFSIDGGINWSSDPDFNNLQQGSYNVIVRVAGTQNCLEETLVFISSPESLEINNLEIIQPSDCISENGSITIDVSLSEAEYSIDEGMNWQASNSFINLSNGVYEVWIRNALATDCFEKRTLEIISPPCPCLDLNIDFSTELVNCENKNSGRIEIIDIDGFFTMENFTFTWGDGTTQNSLENLETGWYSYEIEYDKNCLWSDSIFVGETDPLTFGLITYDEDCSELGSIEVIDFEGGSGNYLFSLGGLDFQPSNVFTNLSSQEYEIYVRDLLDCEEVETTTINANFELSFDLPDVNSIMQGQSTFLNPLINEMTIDSFTWFPNQGILNPGELVAQVSPNETTEYTLTIFFGQCIETRTITIEVNPITQIYIPTIFSPNDDGDNDEFLIQSAPGNNILVNQFNIYDRWGNMVFINKNFVLGDANSGWDGRFNDQKVNIGVYVYYINYVLNGEEFTKAGSITLVR